MSLSTTVTVYGNSPSVATKRKVSSGVENKLGLRYPIKEGDAFFSKGSGAKHLRANLEQMLSTIPGERLMLPRFGASLMRFVFEPMDAETIRQIREVIETSIALFMPEVSVEALTVFPADEFAHTPLPGFYIFLVCKVRGERDTVFDVRVNIGS